MSKVGKVIEEIKGFKGFLSTADKIRMILEEVGQRRIMQKGQTKLK